MHVLHKQKAVKLYITFPKITHNTYNNEHTEISNTFASSVSQQACSNKNHLLQYYHRTILVKLYILSTTKNNILLGICNGLLTVNVRLNYTSQKI